LIELGHSSIATITGPSNEECAQDRLDGHRQAMAAAGLESDPLLSISGDWSAESGREATKQLIKTGRPFTAIFAQNDQMAIGAIRALREAGLHTPADVSVIGFDDIPLTCYFDPPLTTVRQPMEKLGQKAAQFLVHMIKNPNKPPKHALVRALLIERASCASPKRS
ncbi:MAG: substrate-binding domain-containing protein, partial [Anaerolineales bacterium]|nr:substrate-binding domain-containing protein [Anaerolineales bacterium]